MEAFLHFSQFSTHGSHSPSSCDCLRGFAHASERLRKDGDFIMKMLKCHGGREGAGKGGRDLISAEKPRKVYCGLS